MRNKNIILVLATTLFIVLVLSIVYFVLIAKNNNNSGNSSTTDISARTTLKGCEAITLDQAKQFIGGTATQSESGSPAVNQLPVEADKKADVSTCSFEVTDGKTLQAYVNLTVRSWPEDNLAKQGLQDLVNGNHKRVDGYLENAYWRTANNDRAPDDLKFSGELSVLKDNNVIVLASNIDDLEKYKELMNAILKKF